MSKQTKNETTRRQRLQEIEETTIKSLANTYEIWQNAKIGELMNTKMIELLLRKSVVIGQYAYIQYMLPLADEEQSIQQFLEQEESVIKTQIDYINITINNINSGVVS